MECPVCKNIQAEVLHARNDRRVVDCRNCGRYEITNSAMIPFSTKEKDMELSFSIRQRSLKGEIVVINSANIDSIVNGIKIPKTYREISENILLVIYQNEDLLSNGLMISDENLAYFAIQNLNHLQGVLRYLLEYEWVTTKEFLGGNALLHITGRGIDYAESLISPNKDSALAFVAMSFNPELEAIYEEAIKGAIKHCGLEPVRIDDKQFNGEIVKEISEEIDRSRFIVADFTDNRPGVYFEAGYATGKGLPVIYSCKECEKGNIHFDINHFKFIHWENADDLKDELIKRINGTILNQDKQKE